MHLAIRADGGPEIGYGHLVRSSAVAEVATSTDARVTVATTTPDSARDVFPDQIAVHTLPSRHDPAPFGRWLDETSVDVVFADAYPVDTDYQCAIRERVPLVVHQDDTRHTICADALVNGNLYAPDLEYEFVGDRPDQYLGPDYALLRAAVREAARRDPPWREEPERALVTMGGSDTENLTPTVVRAFDGFDLTVDVVVGPGVSAEHERTIRTVANGVSAATRVVRDPDDLVERMYQADFAVATASSTTYELLALGTPLVSVPVVDNQRSLADVLRRLDIGTVVDPDTGVDGLRTAISDYCERGSLRRNRARKGRSLVDSRGAERVHAAIETVV